MRAVILQTHPKIGDADANFRHLEAEMRRLSAKTELFVLPELALVGYPPRDLLSFPAILTAEQNSLQKLAELSAELKVGVLVGHTEKRSGPGKPLWNSASLYDSGKLCGTVRKQRLPAYNIFTEERFFEAWSEGPQSPLPFRGKELGVLICEDSWNSVLAFGKKDVRNYTAQSAPLLSLKEADILINLSASPYNRGKRSQRENLIRAAAAREKKPFLYSNCAGGQDDILFDGCAFAVNAEGEITHRAKAFQEDALVIENIFAPQGTAAIAPEEWPELWQALVMGIKAYVHKSGFTKAVLGLSGGIDSALCAALAADALGAQNVLGVSLPSALTSDLSKNLARDLAKNLGIEFREIPVGGIVKEAASAAKLPAQGLAFENLQSRARGLTLMALSNSENRLLLSTGNKSELSMGYATLYGDMCGALNPLGDLYKTEVYALCHFDRATQGARIPLETITRPPTAELAAGQKDQDSLPDYAALDAFLEAFIEDQGAPLVPKQVEDWNNILGKGHTVAALAKKFSRAEFKRYQSPPILRVHGRAFGSGWQMPLAKGDL